MPTYLSPGVFVEEVSSGPKPIPALPTSTAAFIGLTARGKVREPRRLTSWNDYLVSFGGYHSGSYTPESVFGFFENGGAACFVVRADDDAETARWRVLSGAGTELFAVKAASPGAWGERVAVDVIRAEQASARGELFGTPLTADVSLTSGTAADLTVASTQNVTLDQDVTIESLDGSVSATARVTAVPNGTTLRVMPADTEDFTGHEAYVFVTQPSGETELFLAAGSGFQKGEVVVALQGDGTQRVATVASATGGGVGTLLTLDGPFTADVPGYVFAPKRRWYPARKKNPGQTLTFGGIAFDEALTPSEASNGDQIRVRATGREAVFSSGNWDFGVSVDAGPIRVWAPVWVRLYTETIHLDNPTLGDIDSRWSWFPDGATLVLHSSADATEVSLTRAAGAFAIDSGDLAHVFDSASFELDVQALTGGVAVRAVEKPAAGDWVDFDGARARIETVDQPSGTPANTWILTFAADLAAGDLPPATETAFLLEAWVPTRFESLRFGLSAELEEGGEVVASEVFSELGLRSEHPRYYARDGVVNDVATLIEVEEGAAISVTGTASLPFQAQKTDSGRDGTLTAARIRKALEELEAQQEPAIVAAPDAMTLGDELETAAALNHVVAHCEKMNRFAVLDLPPERDDQKLLEWRQQYIDSTYAAVYAPWVQILNPRPDAQKRLIEVPPSGYVAGVYARTDLERGVHKAPANERVKGVLGLFRTYTTGQQDALNPHAVNLIRRFRGRGIRVWGARNATTDTQWRYVNVRRLFLMIENSIEEGTQWVVFEPNDSSTWLRVRVSVENFLNTIWRAGGLFGAAPEEAYQVRVGLGVTMTQTDIDLGRLIIEVAVAPVKPAEFVIFRISHKVQTE